MIVEPRRCLARAVVMEGCMIDPIFQSENYQLTRKMLDGVALRQEAIAANIANAETPGYRRLDLAPNFVEQLKSSMASGELVRGKANVRATLVEDTNARALRPDGNNVEIEKELLEMNKNSVAHEYLTQLITSNIKQLKMAITGRSA